MRVKTRWATLAAVGLASYAGAFPVLIDGSGHTVRHRAGPHGAMVSRKVDVHGGEVAGGMVMLILGAAGAAGGIAGAAADPAPPAPRRREGTGPDVEA